MLVGVVDRYKFSQLIKRAYAGIRAHVGSIPLILVQKWAILSSSSLRREVAIS